MVIYLSIDIRYLQSPCHCSGNNRRYFTLKSHGHCMWLHPRQTITCSCVFTSNFLIIRVRLLIIINYEWTKRKKFLSAVIYGLLRQHSNISKSFENNWKKLNNIFMNILGLTESFKTINRPDRNALWRCISQKVWKMGMRKFDTIFIQVFNLCYQSLILISTIV